MTMSYARIIKVDKQNILTEIASYNIEHTPSLFDNERKFLDWALRAPPLLATTDVILRERLREQVTRHIMEMVGTICRQNELLPVREGFDVSKVKYERCEGKSVLWVPYSNIHGLEFHFSDDANPDPNKAVMHARGVVKLEGVVRELALRTYKLANPDADGVTVPVIGEHNETIAYNKGHVAVASFHHTGDISRRLYDFGRTVEPKKWQLDDLRKSAEKVREHSESTAKKIEQEYQAELDELAAREDYQNILRFPVPETAAK